MALHYFFEGQMLVFEFEGGTPAHDVYAVFHRAFQDPGCPPSALLLVDLTHSTSLASREPEVVKMLTEYVLQHPSRPGDRMAIAMPAGEATRLEPMIKTVRTGSPVRFQVFDDRNAAVTWLQADRHEAP